MNRWRTLIRHAPQLVEKLQRVNPPKLRLVVDGRVVYWALQVPKEDDLAAHARWPGMSSPSLEGWLVEMLTRFEHGWPQAEEVELLAFWPPDRLEPFARVFPKKAEAGR